MGFRVQGRFGVPRLGGSFRDCRDWGVGLRVQVLASRALLKHPGAWALGSLAAASIQLQHHTL